MAVAMFFVIVYCECSNPQMLKTTISCLDRVVHFALWKHFSVRDCSHKFSVRVVSLPVSIFKKVIGGFCIHDHLRSFVFPIQAQIDARFKLLFIMNGFSRLYFYLWVVPMTEGQIHNGKTSIKAMNLVVVRDIRSGHCIGYIYGLLKLPVSGKV